MLSFGSKPRRNDGRSCGAVLHGRHHDDGRSAPDCARLRKAAGTARNFFKLKKLIFITHKCCQQPLDAIALLGCGEYCNDERPNARICRLQPGMGSDTSHGMASALAAVAGMVRDRSSSTSRMSSCSHMRKQPNGRPRKEPPVPSVKVPPRDFQALVEILNDRKPRQTDDADPGHRPKRGPARRRPTG